MSNNILLIGHSGDMYGASRSLVKLTAILKEEYTVFILLPEKGDIYSKLTAFIPEEHIFIYEGMYIFTRKSFKLRFIFPTGVKFIKTLLAVSKIIRTKNIGIVHTNSGVAPAGALAAKLNGIKHIWHIREWFGDFRQFWPLYRTYMLTLSYRIICVSKTIATQFPASDKVMPIYNGFEIPAIGPKPALPAELIQKLETADLVLGCTSRIRLIRKGQEYLIEAIGMLSRKTGKNIQLLLIGDYVPGYEWQKETLAGLIKNYGLEQNVHFLGHKENPLPYYQYFDVFVLPSGEPEPFGGVIMEAMSLALPVIGSNAGGTTEQIDNGVNGYLFKNQNPADLADKIELFLDDKSKIADFGQRSKERIEEHFSLNLHQDRILKLYNTLI